MSEEPGKFNTASLADFQGTPFGSASKRLKDPITKIKSYLCTSVGFSSSLHVHGSFVQSEDANAHDMTLNTAQIALSPTTAVNLDARLPSIVSPLDFGGIKKVPLQRNETL
jgi:hypothetical protein